MADMDAAARAAFDMQVARWPFMGRALADIRDKPNWARVRAPRCGASDVANFANEESAPLYLKAKLYSPFRGNQYTTHGNDREPHMLAAYNIPQNHTMFAAAGNDRHVATPDGIKLGGDGTFILAQCKTTLQHTKATPDGSTMIVPAFTTAKGILSIPPRYKRQMWWEQYVMGTDRTLFIWEEHANGQPVSMEPESCWLYRDDAEIRKLVTIADIVLEGMDAAEQFRKELES